MLRQLVRGTCIYGKIETCVLVLCSLDRTILQDLGSLPLVRLRKRRKLLQGCALILFIIFLLLVYYK